MSNRSLITFVARFLVLSLIFGVFGIFNTGSTLAAKNRGEETMAPDAQDGSAQLSGQLIATGTVTVNGNKAITGTTVFTDSNIVVDSANGNSAIVDLGKLGRIELIAGTKLILRFSDGLITGDLSEGKAIINSPAGVKVAVNTPNGLISADGAQDTVTPVAVVQTVQTIPVANPAPVAVPAPVPIPVGGGGLSGWAIGGIVAGAGGVAAAAAVAADDDDDVIITQASPTAP